jgi:hypothetical protein
MSKTASNRRLRATRTLLRLAMGWQTLYSQHADAGASSANSCLELLGHDRRGRIRLKRQALSLDLGALGLPRSFEPAWWWEPQKFAAFTGVLTITLSGPRVRGAIRRSSVLKLVEELGAEGFAKALAVPESFSYLAEIAAPVDAIGNVQPALLLALSAIHGQAPLLGERMATLYLGQQGPGLLDKALSTLATNLLDTLAVEASLN